LSILYVFKLDAKNFYAIGRDYYNLKKRWNAADVKAFLTVISVIIVFTFVDIHFRAFSQSLHTAWLDPVFNLFHKYGKGGLTLYLFLIFYFGGLFLNFDKIRKTGMAIGVTYFFPGLIIVALKSIFGRWRPYAEHGPFSFCPFTIGPNDHLSFPSGDAAIAFALSISLASLFDNKAWKIFCYCVAVLTAFGRIYHDQHWLSDVTAASVFSIVSAIYLVRRINNS
jgi:membrane-associated phospholipid phosphatase